MFVEYFPNFSRPRPVMTARAVSLSSSMRARPAVGAAGSPHFARQQVLPLVSTSVAATGPSAVTVGLRQGTRRHLTTRLRGAIGARVWRRVV